jgi:hypothetical protein
MKHPVKFVAAVAIVCLTAALPALALDDTPENRAAQADYYLRVVPPQSLISEMTDKIAATLPEGDRATFKTLMTKNLDIGALANLMRAAMVKNFSADELKAIADFYGSPIGKSAMAKFGNYMADVMGPLRAEMTKAVALSEQQMKAK